ncbi:MAG: hypothetical protein IJ593_07040, partial [Lachnospiraceae bacterium]|nr:hypothetical protein [Lachnospiraceae bacterium]
MSLVAVASFAISKDKNDIVGVRIYNSYTGDIVDVRIDMLKKQLFNGKIIENIKLENGQVRWTNGVYTRYPIIYKDGSVDNRNTPIVLYRIKG